MYVYYSDRDVYVHISIQYDDMTTLYYSKGNTFDKGK